MLLIYIVYDDAYDESVHVTSQILVNLVKDLALISHPHTETRVLPVI